MLRSRLVAESSTHQSRPIQEPESNSRSGRLKEDGLYGSNGFFFQNRSLPLNLRLLSQLDIDRVVRDVDIECLQRHVEQVAFCSLREEELKYVTDQQVIKLFRIAQLIIEYLLHSQDKLISDMNDLATKYASKKRSLNKKRRELAELEESTKQLKHQVRAKKQNISTLEDLLKETNRMRNMEVLSLKRNLKEGQGLTAAPSGVVPEDTARASGGVVSFFVCGPAGLCVEFHESSDMKVRQLLSEARRLFLPGEVEGLAELQLVLRGKVLLPDNALRECDFRSGDTLLLLKNERPGESAAEKLKKQRQKEQEEKEQNDKKQPISELLQLLADQQNHMRDFAHDVKDGWQNALLVITQGTSSGADSNRAAQTELQAGLMEKIDNRWRDLQFELKEHLDANLTRLTTLVTDQTQRREDRSVEEIPLRVSLLSGGKRVRLVAGDLEDDIPLPEEQDRERQPTPNQIDHMHDQASAAASVVQELRAALDTQAQQISELTALLKQSAMQQPKVIMETPIQPQFVAVEEVVEVKQFQFERPPPETPQMTEKIEVDYPPSQTIIVEEKVEVQEEEISFPAQSNLEDEHLVTTFVSPSPAPAPAPALVVVEEQKKVEVVEMVVQPVQEEVIAVEEMVDEVEGEVLFPVQRMPASVLRALSTSGRRDVADVKVCVKDLELGLDDAVFEIRRAVAIQTRLPLGRVFLTYHPPEGEPAVSILLGMDLEELMLKYRDEGGYSGLKALAADGRLRLGVASDRSISNSQIDHLSRSLTAQSLTQNFSDEKPSIQGWSDEIEDLQSSIPTMAAQNDSYHESKLSLAGSARELYRVKSQLKESLDSVSDREGISDKELSEKLSRLDEVTQTLPGPLSNQLRMSRNSLVGALSNAALTQAHDMKDSGLDSESDDLSSFPGPNLRMSMSINTASRPHRSNSQGESGWGGGASTQRRRELSGSLGDTQMLRLSLGADMRSSGAAPSSSSALGVRRQRRDLLRLSDDSPMMASSSSLRMISNISTLGPSGPRSGSEEDEEENGLADRSYNKGNGATKRYQSWRLEEDLPSHERSEEVGGRLGFGYEAQSRDKNTESVDSFKKFLRRQGEEEGEGEDDGDISRSTAAEGKDGGGDVTLLHDDSSNNLLTSGLGLSLTADALALSSTLTTSTPRESSLENTADADLTLSDSAVLSRAGRLEGKAQAMLSIRTERGGGGSGSGSGQPSFRSTSSDPAASPFPLIRRGAESDGRNPNPTSKSNPFQGRATMQYSLNQSGSEDGDSHEEERNRHRRLNQPLRPEQGPGDGDGDAVEDFLEDSLAFSDSQLLEDE